MPTETSALTARIKAEAARLGFFACGVARAEAVDDTVANAYRQWLERHGNADMTYLENNLEKRLDPRLLMPGVRSIVSVALNYAPARRMADNQLRLAMYAYGRDYHDVVKAKLRQLAAAMGFHPISPTISQASQTDSVVDYRTTFYRAFVDTAPVMERYWAVRAGLGWIGRNQQLIIPHAGSMFFLGELFVTATLDYDHPRASRCGNCHACVDACPTGALRIESHPRIGFDAYKCLSYQTIENRGELSESARQNIGKTIYGCDRCTLACPWNNFATPNTTPELQPTPELMSMTREQWMQLSEDDYRKLFKGSAVKRAKYDGLRRNIAAATDASNNKARTMDNATTWPGGCTD